MLKKGAAFNGPIVGNDQVNVASWGALALIGGALAFPQGAPSHTMEIQTRSSFFDEDDTFCNFLTHFVIYIMDWDDLGSASTGFFRPSAHRFLGFALVLSMKKVFDFFSPTRHHPPPSTSRLPPTISHLLPSTIHPPPPATQLHLPLATP